MKKVSINRKGRGLFDILTDGIAIGCGSMMEAENEGDFNYLERFDIYEEHQGQGYGTAALQALTEIYGSYFLAPDSEGARRLYERVGCEANAADYDRFGFAVDAGFGVYEIS